ncbi:peptidoglycan editing factor PgeF [candidate division KSB1 bacterium]
MKEFPALPSPFTWHRSGGLAMIEADMSRLESGPALTFSTRVGGVSSGPYEGLNLSLKGEDDRDLVLANRALLSKGVGFPLERLVVMQQVHGSAVLPVGPTEAGRGAYDPRTGLPEVDGLVTADGSICLSVSTADCVPVALFDPKTGAVAGIHAGWRGLLGGVIESGIAALADNFGSAAGDCWAFLGPSIGPCCFEVGLEVAARFRDRLGDKPIIVRPETPRPYVDLLLASRMVLEAAAVAGDKIKPVGLCTCCNPHLFYSYRRDGRRTGSQMMWVRRP